MADIQIDALREVVGALERLSTECHAAATDLVRSVTLLETDAAPDAATDDEDELFWQAM